MQRLYLNLKLSRNLTDKECAKRMGISRDELIKRKKQWGMKFRRQKDNIQGVSEYDFNRGSKIGLSRSRILKRVRDLGWDVERAVTEKLDKTKINHRGSNKND